MQVYIHQYQQFALWGPLHGENQAVIEMLENIRRDGGDVEKYVAGSKR